MVAVAGPRIDPAEFPTHPGLEVHGYVDRLYRHLSVCDLAVVQGGLTTTMELAAAKRPFLYFPLAHHFEQNFHVRHRLDRYGAGRCMDYATTDPDDLAAAIAETIGQPVDVPRRRDRRRRPRRPTHRRARLTDHSTEIAETSIVSSVASYCWVNRRYSKPSLVALLEVVNGGSPRARPRFRSSVAMSAAVLSGLTAWTSTAKLSQ